MERAQGGNWPSSRRMRKATEDGERGSAWRWLRVRGNQDGIGRGGSICLQGNENSGSHLLSSGWSMPDCAERSPGTEPVALVLTGGLRPSAAPAERLENSGIGRSVACSRSCSWPEAEPTLNSWQ